MMTTMLVAAAQGVADTVSGMNPVLTVWPVRVDGL